MAKTFTAPAIASGDWKTALTVSIELNKEPTAADLMKLYRPAVPDGKQLTDFLVYQDNNQDLVVYSDVLVDGADVSLGECTAARSVACDDAKKEANSSDKLLRRLNRAVEDNHGKTVAGGLGLSSKIPGRRTKKRTMLLRVKQLMEGVTGELPLEPDGTPVDLEKAIALLNAAYTRLDKALTRSDKAKADVQTKAQALKKAVKLQKAIVVGVAAIQEQFYLLTGRDDLASQLRPIIRPASRPADTTGSNGDAKAGTEAPAGSETGASTDPPGPPQTVPPSQDG